MSGETADLVDLRERESETIVETRVDGDHVSNLVNDES